ncbi:hypothetical protein MMC28_001742 [Mycoblastus sanguinarius]|nr:hypothetical protein [Mycoblastus sanguinarius]
MGGDWKNRDHYGYGFGRRSCPGIHLAERNMFLAIAKLLWALRFEPKVGADGKEVPINSSPDKGYHQGFLYCAKDYECQITVRSERIRETLLREFEEAKTNVFSQFAEQSERRLKHVGNGSNDHRIQQGCSYSVRKYWNGETVRIPKNGDLRIFVSTGQPALLLRLGKSINGNIHENGGPAVIEFSKTGIALKVGKHIVYEKSREMLLRLKDGSR